MTAEHTLGVGVCNECREALSISPGAVIWCVTTHINAAEIGLATL